MDEYEDNRQTNKIQMAKMLLAMLEYTHLVESWLLGTAVSLSVLYCLSNDSGVQNIDFIPSISEILSQTGYHCIRIPSVITLDLTSLHYRADAIV